MLNVTCLLLITFTFIEAIHQLTLLNTTIKTPVLLKLGLIVWLEHML